MLSKDEIDDLAGLHRVLGALTSGSWFFRGQANEIWQLLPKAGRPDYYLGDPDETNWRDIGRFNVWRQQAVAYSALPENDLECLAVAQHHGLATRLLDWTTNPLIGLYFAVYEHPDVDGALYCYSPCCFIDAKTMKLETENTLGLYKPRSISSRILNQSGAFTYHGRPSQLFTEYPTAFGGVEMKLWKLTIRKKSKPALLSHLNLYGINHVTLFPDLDGLSRHVNWETLGILQRRAIREARKRQGVAP